MRFSCFLNQAARRQFHVQTFFKAAAKGSWFLGIMLLESPGNKKDVKMGEKSRVEGRKTAPK